MNRNVLVGGAVLLLIGGFAVGANVYQSNKAAQAEADQKALAADAAAAAAHAEAIDRAGAQRMGPADAKVVITEFFDPACETCAEFAPYVKEFITQYPGQVQIVSRYAPFHPGSDKMVAILEATRHQDRYWVALDILFSNQKLWADHQNPQPDLVWGLLEQGGLDVARLRAEANDPAIAAVIAEDVKDCKTLGVTQTPEFFVDGKPLPTWGMQQLVDLVASEVKAKYGAG